MARPLDAIKFQLNDGRNRTLDELRKSDPDLSRINLQYTERVNRLGANFYTDKNMPRGRVSDLQYTRQRENLQRIRDEAENEKIRPAFIQGREKMLHDSFGGDEKTLNQARKDLDKDPSLQWLRDPNEKKKEAKDIDYKKESQEEKAQLDVKNAPDLSARFDDVSEKNYHDSHARFNRAAKTKDPQYLKGYHDKAAPERKTFKSNDYTKHKEQLLSKKFPGLDNYSSSVSGAEPAKAAKEGPDIDIGDKD